MDEVSREDCSLEVGAASMGSNDPLNRPGSCPGIQSSDSRPSKILPQSAQILTIHTDPNAHVSEKMRTKPDQDWEHTPHPAPPSQTFIIST